MQEQPHWRRLLLRSKETAERYQTEISSRKINLAACHLCLDTANIFREYEYWFLMHNEFPYDRYFSKSDMLLLKRHTKESELTEQEKEELLKLKNEVLADEYDAILDHLPKQRSIPSHHHVHLIEFKRHDGVSR